MGKKDVELELGGDEADLVASLNRAKAAVLENTASMRAALSGVQESFKGLSAGFSAIAAVMAGGAAFKEAINQTKEITSSAIKLGRSLGISATEASGYNAAIDEVGGTTQDFADASQGLTRQLKNHEKALNDMGIVTRDANGALKSGNDLLFEAIDAVNSYKEGTDRNLAAQTAFGRGASANSAVFRLNKEDMDRAAASARELGLIVGQEDVDAYKENKKSTAEAVDVLKGMAKAVGDAVLPVLTELGDWFRTIGPAAIVVIKGAVGGLVAVFWGLVNAVTIVGNIVYAVFKTIIETFNNLLQAADAAIHGHFKEAGNALKQIPQDTAKTWGTAFSNIVDSATKTRDKLTNLFANKTDTVKPPDKKSFNLEKKEDGPDLRFEQYKNSLDRMRQAADDFDHKDIAADLAFWEQKLALTNKNTKADEKLRAEIGRTILGLQRKQHDEQIKMDQEAAKTTEALELGQVEAKRAALQQELALGNITRRQEAQAEMQLAEEEFHIRQRAIQRELQLNQFDLAGQQKLKNEELKLEQKHAADVQKIINKEALEEHKVWDSLFKNISSGWQTTIAGFLKGTSSIGGAVKGLFKDVTSSVINSLAMMAAKNLEVIVQSLLLHKTAAMAQIKTDAAKAASGAYQAVVGIPYVGPFLAPAAAAVAYGATLAFGASAKGGYDIPSNVNPMVQAHAREMILPQPIADPLRQMIKRGALGGGGNTYISAVDARSLHRALTGSGSRSPLAKGLRSLSKRNYKL